MIVRTVMIIKGYPQKPTSQIIGQVLKGFIDNPFLQKKHQDARAKASKLRHDFMGGTPNNSDNSGSLDTVGNQ